MSSMETESAILERVKSNLSAEGFDVVLYPSALQLPHFLQKLKPDAIASRGAENLVIEVLSRSSGTDHKVRRYREALAGQDGWTLRTVWTSGNSVPPKLDIPSKALLEERLTSIQQLIDGQNFDAAMLLGWATLEGAGRNLIPSAVQRPQTPRRLVEQLEKFGLVTSLEGKYLREISELRNRLIHGDLAVKVSNSQAIALVGVLRRLLS